MNENYQYSLDRLTGERERINTAIRFLRKHRKVLTRLNLLPSLCYNKLDFDNLSRPDILKVIKAFPGKWEKNKNCGGDRINYELSKPIDGITLRIYGGEPPASCRIVETVEYVTVPEHVERVVTRSLECPKVNVLGGTVTLGGDVVPAENALTSEEPVND